MKKQIVRYKALLKIECDSDKAMLEDFKQFGFDEDYKLKYSKLFCDTFATDVSYRLEL